MRKLLGAITLVLVALLLLGGLAALGARWFYGPLGPIPGPGLSGPVTREPVTGWSHVDAIQVIQVETRPESPYTVHTWVTRVGDAIYIFSGTEDKTWVRNILEDPRVRVRIDGRIHERLAVRAEALEEKRAFLAPLRSKYEGQPEFDLEEWQRAWDSGEVVVFRLEPR